MGGGGALAQQTHPRLEEELLTAGSRVQPDGVCVLQPAQVDVLHRSLEGAQAVAQLVLAGEAEAEVPDVAQVGYPGESHRVFTATVVALKRCCSPLCLPPAGWLPRWGVRTLSA